MAISNETVVYTLLGRDQLSKTFLGVQKNAALLAGGVLAAGAALVKIGSDFDKAYDTIRVGTGATGKALEGLKGDFKAVVKDVPASFGDASKAVADLNTRTGLTGKPLQQLSKQFLELSRITGEDLGQSIPNLTRLFGDWSIAGQNQAATMDKLFRASQATGIGVNELSDQMVNFGSPLRQLGIDFDFATAMFARFEKEGVNTKTVLPGLKMALKNFASEGKDAGTALMETFTAIKSAGSAAEANTIAFEVFGARAGPDLAAAILEGRFDLDALMKTIKGGKDTILGAAEDTKDFTQTLLELKNKAFVVLEPVAMAVFDGIGAAIDGVVATIGALKSTWDGMPQWLQIGVTAWAGVTAAALLAKPAFGAAKAAILAVKGAAETAYLKLLLMSRGMKILTLSMGGIGLLLAAAATAIELFGGESAEAKQRQQELADAGAEVAQAIRDQNGAINESVVAKAAEKAEQTGLLTHLKAMGFSYGDVTKAILGQGDALDRIRTKLQTVADQGGPFASFESNAAAIQAQHLLDTLNGLVGGKNRDTEASKRQKQATDEAIGGRKKEKKAAVEQYESIKDLIAAKQEEAGVVLSSREAQRQYEEAIDNARASVKEHGKELRKDSQHGRANQEALDQIADAAHRQSESMRAAHAPTSLLRAKMKEAREEFIKAATRMGMSKKAADKLADSLNLIPGQYEADITADTKKGHDKVDSFMRKDIARVTKRFKAIIDADTSDAAAEITQFIKKQQNRGIVLSTEGKFLGFRGTGGVRRAQGGPINGPGSGTSDSIPAWLSNGEFVINAASTRKHRGLVEAINQDKVPRFAKGGAAVTLPVDANMSGWLTGVNAMIAKFAESMSGPAGLLGWARKHHGSPYVWGAAGPSGFDCSGWVSALVNHARGDSAPYFRLGSTATFPWGGFERGPGRYLSVGSTKNAGNGIGHMAASIGRTPAESAGGVGVRVSGGARGAFDGLFGGNVWHPRGMRAGGLVDRSKGDLPFDLIDPKGRYARLRLASFDQGGYLMPGYTLAHNGTGRPERVVKGGGGDIHYHVTVNTGGVMGQTTQDVQNAFVKTLVSLDKQGRLPKARG